MRPMRRLLRTSALWLALLVPTPVLAQAGLLLGTVTDAQGARVAGARAELEGSRHRATTGDDGRFVFDSVLAGSYVLRVTREGYREARAEVRIPADSAVQVEIRLESEGQQLGGVVVRDRLRNRVYGVVLGTDDRPRPGTRVIVVGLARELETDQDGIFSFADLPTGEYLLEVREEGHPLVRYSIKMVEGVERAVTLRLRRVGEPLTRRDIENAEMATREAASRESLRRRSSTVVIGRDELARHERASLAWVLNHVAPNLFRPQSSGAAGGYCVLVDGLRPFGVGQVSANVANAATGNSIVPGGKAPVAERIADGWLDAFYADQAERVELFPADTDDSRTICSRFSLTSGCGCGPGGTPPAVVVWLRR